jgi:hypothetical protein
MDHSEAGGWVYAAQEDGTPLVKIGFTEYPHPLTRVLALRWVFHCSFTLIAAVAVSRGVRCFEKAIHAQLAAEHVEGEFFYLYMTQTLLESLVDRVRPEIYSRLEREAVKRRRRLAR